jgi:CMP-N-acetylneuraminic acid synthetase
MSNEARKAVCIVPARGGSKRIPRKNIVPLHGKPLIAWALEAVLASEIYERVYVSTEDREIAAVAVEFGAEVPYMRPDELARDGIAAVYPAVHLVEFLKERGEEYEDVCVSDPTAPFIGPEDHRIAYETFVASGVEVLHSVCAFEHPPQRALYMDGDRAKPLYGTTEVRKESQELVQTYRITGGIQIVRTDYLLKNQSYHSDSMAAYIVDQYKGVDIDTPDDLALAEYYLERQDRQLGNGGELIR